MIEYDGSGGQGWGRDERDLFTDFHPLTAVVVGGPGHPKASRMMAVAGACHLLYRAERYQLVRGDCRDLLCSKAPSGPVNSASISSGVIVFTMLMRTFAAIAPKIGIFDSHGLL